MQDIRTDDETFERGDQTVEAEDKADVPEIVRWAEGYGKNGTDHREHGAEGRDELKDRSEESPERRERDVEEFEASEPEDSDDEGIEGDGSPPADEGSACGA